LRVLIVKTSALGDVVHALPVLAYLRSAVENIEIDWLVEAAFAPVLENHPFISKVIPVATRQWRGPGGHRRAVRELRELGALFHERVYGVAVDLQGNSKSGLFTLFSRAPKRYGFGLDAAREWPNLFATNHHVPLGASDRHITDRYLRIVRTAFPGGTEPPPTGPLFASKEAAAWAAKWLCEKGLSPAGFALFHPGTTWNTKRWALFCWRQLARATTLDLRTPVVLSWGSDEELQTCRAVAGSAADGCLLAPRMSLRRFLGLLHHARLVVGGDTGPVHLAAALGIPTISLFRATDSLRNGPRGPKHRAFQSPLLCSPCLKRNCDRDPSCSRTIAPSEVLSAVQDLLDFPMDSESRTAMG